MLCGFEVKVTWDVDGGLQLLTCLIVDGFLVLEEVLVLGKLSTVEDIHHYVRLTDVDEHVVFENLKGLSGTALITYYRLLLPDEHSISDAEILDKVGPTVQIVLDLEVSAPVLLSCLLVFVWNYKVVHHTFLELNLLDL